MVLINGCLGMHQTTGNAFRVAGRGAASTAQNFAQPSTSFSRHTRNVTSGRSCNARGRLEVVCMANQRRVARVSKQIEREMSVLLQGDQVIQNAICPEHRVGYDSSLSALASVTEVQLSSDLQVAKVYLSIYSDKEGRALALKGLSRLQGYVRTRLANQMQLRMVPEIRFIHDEAAERGEEVLALLEQIKRQNAGEEDMPPVVLPDGSYGRNSAAPAGSSGRDGEDEEDGFLDLEDDEEGGFLVDDFQADAIGWGSDQEDEDDQFYTKTTVAGNFAGYDYSFDYAEEKGSGGRQNNNQRRKRKSRSKKR